MVFLKWNKGIALFVLLFVFFSCKETEKEELARLVTAWQGKEIEFPPEMVFTRYIKDTVDYQVPESDYKVLIYTDESGCVACKSQLDKWKLFMAEVDSIGEKPVPFLFFFDHTDKREVHFLLIQSQFDLPVCVDQEGQLNKLNQFPKDRGFDTFLLDKNNKVVVIGNPIHNLVIRDLYLAELKKENTPSEKEIRTIATVSSNEIDMGVFPKTEKRTATFHLQNTGDNPLVIIGASTTCGCASVWYDKHPANVGDHLKIEITMTPKEKGFFSETITVKCNTDKAITLTVKGRVE